MNRPFILVTNDDGIFAPGIKALINVASAWGEVIVVAPDSPRSAQGHAITLEQPLRFNRVDLFDGVEAYETNGTPVDCVKLSRFILQNRKQPTLCVSGINHGSNASTNIIYSGTVSAAMEAAMEGIPSLAFSLCNYAFDTDFSAAQKIAANLIQKALEQGLNGAKLLNINIPYLPYEKIKGIKVCRQADGKWVEEFIEGADPRGQKYYWLSGKYVSFDDGADTDIGAIKEGYVSVVPSMHDLTDYSAMPKIKHLEIDLF